NFSTLAGQEYITKYTDSATWGNAKNGPDNVVLASAGQTVYDGQEGGTFNKVAGISTSTFYADDGNDTITGLDRNDSIYGGKGNDSLYGGDGSDYLAGGAGSNLLYGGAGSDTLTAFP